MDKIRTDWRLFILSLIFFCACQQDENITPEQLKASADPDSSFVELNFHLEINKSVYQKTNFGDPPQLAIWIKDLKSELTRTVWVSHRTAKNDWKGKVECPVALPFWQAETGNTQSTITTSPKQSERIDIPTGATPLEGNFMATIRVPKGSEWDYYIEVNVSADYNHSFPYWSNDGLPDSEANGQPSIIYAGRIKAKAGHHDYPKLIGRTEQRRGVHSLSIDLSGITSAKNLINNIEVQCN